MPYNRKLLYTKTVPSWNTPGGYLGSFDQTGSPITPIQLSSSNDPVSEITYTVTLGSLPNGLTLSDYGEISGTLTGYSANQDVFFTIKATDAEGEFEERDFNISVGGFPYSIDYLIVAGGGGGGEDGYYGSGGGGGGAGGFISSSITGIPANSSTVYAISVGSGGVGTFNHGAGTNGNNSSISGVATAIGGGGGGGYNDKPGKNGGSGGGSAFGETAGTGVAGQGNNGGSANGNTNGGGGAGSSTTSANGGIGAISTLITPAISLANSIGEVSGSDVYFSGGGGGKSGSGGLGGGANGCSSNPGCTSNAAISGLQNSGGGGGVSLRYGTNGGAGGSGVVILRMPTGAYSGNVTGSPIVEVDGTDTILIYTGSGTYTT
jgi:hypothetical protein